LPAVAALLSLLLYARSNGWCNPFVDDCVSISRMARHEGLATSLFRALVLPGAVLQALTWLAGACALFDAGLARRRALLLAALGSCASLMLVVYGSFLGTDGPVYPWLRRWGTLTYFGGTYLTMLSFASAVLRLRQAQRLTLPPRLLRVVLALLAFIGALGLLHGFSAAAAFAVLEDRIENLTEWWGSLALTLVFVTMGSIWRHWDMRATLRAHGNP
jgi:hypothetical protein